MLEAHSNAEYGLQKPEDVRHTIALQRNSVASAVSRLFCFAPDDRGKELHGSLDSESCMSLSISHASYNGNLAPAILSATPEIDQYESTSNSEAYAEVSQLILVFSYTR